MEISFSVELDETKTDGAAVQRNQERIILGGGSASGAAPFWRHHGVQSKDKREREKTGNRSIAIERVPYKVFIIAQRLEKLVQQVKDDAEIMQAYLEENRELASRKTDGWKETC